MGRQFSLVLCPFKQNVGQCRGFGRMGKYIAVWAQRAYNRLPSALRNKESQSLPEPDRIVSLSVENQFKRRNSMKLLVTYLQPDEEVQYRARIYIFLFLQPAILSGIGFMCYLDSVSITHYLGVILIFLGLVSLVQRVFIKVAPSMPLQTGG